MELPGETVRASVVCSERAELSTERQGPEGADRDTPTMVVPKRRLLNTIGITNLYSCNVTRY